MVRNKWALVFTLHDDLSHVEQLQDTFYCSIDLWVLLLLWSLSCSQTQYLATSALTKSFLGYLDDHESEIQQWGYHPTSFEDSNLSLEIHFLMTYSQIKCMSFVFLYLLMLLLLLVMHKKLCKWMWRCHNWVILSLILMWH